LAVVITYRKYNVVGRYRQRLIRVDYGNLDTSLVVDTGFSKIHAYTVSAPSVTTKAVDIGTVAGGTITLTVTDPAAACYIYIDAIGN
jgi:hypothetical protein